MTRAQTAPAASRAGSDILLSPAVFADIAQRVYGLTGIVLKEHKRQMVCTRLTKRLRVLQLESFEAYLAYLAGPDAKDEVGELINAITTNLTSFFRESHHFDHLRDEIIRPRMDRGAQRLRIWSAGCSTGEEPYTIQMTLDEVGALSRKWDYKLLATDLDSAVLARASAGRYSAERFAQMDAGLQKRHFTAQPDGSHEVRPGLRDQIRFRQLNLLENWPFGGPFDAIFCRNVLIYFDAETKASLIDRFAEKLTKDGALYLGHSESLLGEHKALKALGRTIYRRKP
ncbi:MAG: protein-glutamate O-methyltransferase CheR [Pseudomonadota bacterium]